VTTQGTVTVTLTDEHLSYLRELLDADVAGTEELLADHADQHPAGCLTTCGCRRWAADLDRARYLLTLFEAAGSTADDVD
jgi:hypothetical protein